MTQVLTPQKAAELLKELQYAKVRMGGQLSIRDEYFKQALEQLPRWIACDERMPEVGQDILIRIPVCNCFNIENAKYKGDDQFIGAWCETRGKGRAYSVTHWMPLPEAPL